MSESKDQWPPNDETWFIHLHASRAELFQAGSLSSLPYSLMPAVGEVVKDFGAKLLAWHEEQREKSDHACLTGDCPHQTQTECWHKLVADCLADLRESETKDKP
ncbi:MAG: hypothetical protein KGL39_02810 [Patescibacteria group bacterium]|nr:hypothetical protein [Patescibacteria group bacterium]